MLKSICKSWKSFLKTEKDCNELNWRLRRSHRRCSLRKNHLLLPHIKLSLKTKRDLELFSLSHFLHDFWGQYFSCYVPLADQISLSGCLYFVRYWAICVLQLFVKQFVTPKILKLTLSFKLCFLHEQKVKIKI